MICNVCGEDNRCYMLAESELHGPMLRPVGLMFSICASCLEKLIEPIRTERTVLDDSVKPGSAKEMRDKLRDKVGKLR